MQYVNYFHKGINTDSDVSKRENSEWTMPTENIRFVNKEGKGLVATNINGNDFDIDNEIGIEFPKGFIPLGKQVFNGIAYFVLYNETTDEGEIGCYPSPKAIRDIHYYPYLSSTEATISTGVVELYLSLHLEIKRDVGIELKYNDSNYMTGIVQSYNPISGRLLVEVDNIYGSGTFSQWIVSISCGINKDDRGFERIYKPLVNFGTTGKIRQAFRSEFMTLNKNNLIDLQLRPNFDTSLNMYMADGHNYNRVINTGFKSNGELKEPAYTDLSFPCDVSQIPLVGTIPLLGNLTIEPGGKWMSGNIFIYIAYVTKEFNRTHIVSEIGPIQIFEGSLSYLNSVQGIKGSAGETGVQHLSDKRIVLDLTNIDTKYEYLELYAVRNYSDDVGTELRDIFKIEHYYKIESPEMKIIISGIETFVKVTEAEILRKPINELTCESFAIIDNRYYGANWKVTNYHNNFLTEYAKRIIPFRTNAYIDRSIGYKDYQNVLNRVGYFRCESYPFAIRFIFKGGLESDCYPVQGIDDILTEAVDTNDKDGNVTGIYRFPNNNRSPVILSDLDKLNVMGISFYAGNAEDYREGDRVVREWFEKNIEGFFIMRGERFKNMMYQGITMYGTRSYRVNHGTNYLGAYLGIQEQWEEAKSVFNGYSDSPSSETDAPFCTTPNGGSGISYKSNDDYVDYSEGWAYLRDRIGSFRRGRADNSDWAKWLGQPHMDYTDVESDNEYWGANRAKTENVGNSGKFDEQNPGDKGSANHIIANDDSGNEDSSFVIPAYKGFIPICMVQYKNPGTGNIIRNSLSRSYYVEKKYAFFSPDYLFDVNSHVPKGAVIIRLARVSFTDNRTGLDRSQFDGTGIVGAINPSHASDVYPWWYLSKVRNYDKRDDSIPITDFNLYDVPKYTTIPLSKHGFVSEYTDPGFSEGDYGMTQSGTCMWSWIKYGGRQQGGGNRSMSTAKYVGIKFASNKTMFNHNMISIFGIDPYSVSGPELAQYFDLKNIEYSNISQFININNVGTLHYYKFFKGDCFLQTTFFKQMGWRGSSWQASDNLSGDNKDNRANNSEQPEICFGHGLIMEVITENAVNTEMRYNFELRTYYPFTNERTFAISNTDTSDKTESFLMNKGYNKTLSLRKWYNFNKNLPFVTTEYTTRIRYSDKYDEGSFIDAFRNMNQNDYKDYNAQHGPIVRVCEFNNYLISFQHDKINSHITSQRQVQVQSTEGALALGTGDILAAQVNILSNIGIYHKWSVLVSPGGIYSINFNKRLLQRIRIESGNLGSIVLSDEKNISSYIYSIFESFAKETDIVKSFSDSFYNGQGISVGYDTKYKDALFTIYNKDSNIFKTFAFNEDLDVFTGEYSFHSPIYLSLNNDFYSFEYDGTVDKDRNGKMWLHDRDDKVQSFYGSHKDALLSFIVNGLDEQQNTSLVSKRFDSMEVQIDQDGLKQIDYSTDTQNSSHTDFNIANDKFWLKPEHSENKFRFPIISQQQPIKKFWEAGVETFEGSNMRGTFLKATFVLDGTKRKTIKNIFTNYSISYF